jgi:hypothetical protein
MQPLDRSGGRLTTIIAGRRAIIQLLGEVVAPPLLGTPSRGSRFELSTWIKPCNRLAERKNSFKSRQNFLQVPPE